MLLRGFLTASLALLILTRWPARADEVKGVALVEVDDPRRGSLP
jgi:hypothetical protein